MEREPKFDIASVAMIIGIFPLAIFIISFINLKVSSIPNISDIISSSINDFPLSNFKYSNICNESEYSQTLYNFTGSKSGCSCVGIKNYELIQDHKEEVFPEKCNYNQTINGCTKMGKIEGKLLFNWKNGRFCSKLYNQSETGIDGYLYYLNNSVLENESCQEGYKKCGKLDQENYLCYPEEEECPINDIIHSDGENPDLVNKNYSYVNIGDQYYYYTNNKTDNPVIVKLKVSTKNLCLYKKNLYTDYPQYILDNSFENYGCQIKINDKFYDKNIYTLDKRKKVEFFEDSDLEMNKIYTPLYDYPLYSLQEEMFLHLKKYYGFNKKCLMENGGLNMNTFVYREEKITEAFNYNQYMTNMNQYTLTISLFAFLIEVFACTLFILDIDSVSLFLIFYGGWTFVNLLFYTFMAIPIYNNYSTSKKTEIFPLCGDDELNGIISAFNRPLKVFKVTMLIQVIFLNLQIVFNVIIIILRVFFLFGKPGESLLNKKTNKDIDYNKTPEKPENPENTENPEEPYYNQK
jgi:hypothetical protein